MMVYNGKSAPVLCLGNNNGRRDPGRCGPSSNLQSLPETAKLDHLDHRQHHQLHILSAIDIGKAGTKCDASVCVSMQGGMSQFPSPDPG